MIGKDEQKSEAQDDIKQSTEQVELNESDLDNVAGAGRRGHRRHSRSSGRDD